MRKILLTFALLITATIVMAIPAKRGVWKTMQLKDGSSVKVQLMGDEVLHYYQDADNNVYVTNGEQGLLELADLSSLQAKAKSRMNSSTARRVSSAKRKIGGIGNPYLGTKKGLIILVNFADKTFADSNNQTFFNRIANEEGFTSTDGFVGSVKDYFKAQSGGQFELDFDVVGPVTVSHNYSYYGANGSDGNDKYPGAMAAEACEAAKDMVNFADYDWDNDGEVDQVFILYAGMGEADGGASATIWPHAWELSSSDYGKKLYLDNVYIDTYACSCELDGNNTINGIGTICHEFSHCLGLPDMYDTSYSGSSYGMDSWDLMDCGCYNGNGFVPAGYTSYEKMVAGWLTPIELKDDMSVTSQKALSEGGDAYIIYNDNFKDEFYLLENRQKTGWDTNLDGEGLLILHVDYDASIWYYNTVNNVSSHQHCTIFHADNKDGGRDNAGDPYPYTTNDCLTNTSTPKASLFNKNTDGSKLLNKSVTGITRNADGTISFEFSTAATGGGNTGGNTGGDGEDVIFYESFDDCSGIGGNDDRWSGSIATGAFAPDLAGWDADYAYGANKCAKFNTSSKVSDVKTPSFTLDGDAVLTFKAAPWGNDGKTLDVRLNGQNLQTYTLTASQWTEISLNLTGSGASTITFMPDKRFFLDEVKITKATSTGINTISNGTQTVKDGRIYNLNGQYVGKDMNMLPKGIYVVNGRKVVK